MVDNAKEKAGGGGGDIALLAPLTMKVVKTKDKTKGVRMHQFSL